VSISPNGKRCAFRCAKLRWARVNAAMLHCMSETLAAAPAPGVASFASFLAGLAAPETTGSDEWNVDDLAEDIATISYEHGLRAQSSHPAGDGPALHTGLNSVKLPAGDAAVATAVATKGRGTSASAPRTGVAADSRKLASITIRLSHVECAQLHERAAAAGMTISAYLRSCTFEVEALRAQVKEALAQFNSAAAVPVEPKTPERPVASFQTWRSRFFPRRPAQA
jgi:hypothetical protein